MTIPKTISFAAMAAAALLLAACAKPINVPPEAKVVGDAGPQSPSATASTDNGRAPGADGVPSAPFGGYNYDAFKGDRLKPGAPVDLKVFMGEPKDAGHWNPDFAALQEMATYYGRTAGWCSMDTAMLGDPGIDCCSSDAPFSSARGFDPDAGADAGPMVSCGLMPDSWRVGTALASVGLRGLSTVRPLKIDEIRWEISNGRPVLTRSNFGQFGFGAMIIIAGWARIDTGGYRVLLVHEGDGFHWSAYDDIIAGRDTWLAGWTNSWYHVSATIDGCVPSFDPSCGS